MASLLIFIAKTANYRSDVLVCSQHIITSNNTSMADNNEDQEIEEPAQLVEEIPHQQPTDHIPLKDEFSSDLSDIEFLDVP